MKKTILAVLLASTVLVGCSRQPKSYGHITDYSAQETEDYHVLYAQGSDGCYSDGSFDSNMTFNYWVKRYEERHN